MTVTDSTATKPQRVGWWRGVVIIGFALLVRSLLPDDAFSEHGILGRSLVTGVAAVAGLVLMWIAPRRKTGG